MTTKKLMLKLPTILAVVFMLVQVSGLSAYIAKRVGVGDFLSHTFAVCIETGVFACAYWMRQSITNKNDKFDWRDIWTRIGATVGVVVFMAVSGYLNTAKSVKDLPVGYDQVDYVSALVLGVFPTIAAALLGMLQGLIDRLPVAPSHSTQSGRMTRVYALLDNLLTLAERRTSPQAPAQNAPNAKSVTKKCPQCGVSVANMGSHTRWNHPKAKP